MEFYTKAIEILEKYDITKDLPTYLNHLYSLLVKLIFQNVWISKIFQVSIPSSFQYSLRIAHVNPT